MAIRDLLWACPLCGAVGALHRARGGDACEHCHTLYRRGRGSHIDARRPGQAPESRPAADWVTLLPAQPPAPTGAGPGRAGDPAPGRGPARRPVPGPAIGASWREERVLARFALGEEPIRLKGAYLGSREILGPERPGRLALTTSAIRLHLDEGGEHLWPLEDVAALQASSHDLQLRPRRQALVSFAFPDSSARLWEESIAAALRIRWRELGRGEIREFQPRIVAR